MKRMKILPAVILSAALLSGCSYLGLTPSSSAAPAVSQTRSSSSAANTPSAAPAQSTASAASKAAVSQTAPAQSAASKQETAPEQNGAVKTVTTDNAAFDAKFSENPLDRVYVADMQLAVSTLDMVQVSNKYAALWQNEVENGCAQMKTTLASNSEKLKNFTDEQTKWEDGKDAAIAKISAEVSAEGGSMGRVNAASAVMEYSRARAAAVYRQLYDFSKDYTYAFAA